MNTYSFIKERYVHQGDLVFIIHKEKPYKTGWWRKLRFKNDNDDQIYVLEHPVFNGDENGNGRKINGYYVMKNITLKAGSDSSAKIFHNCHSHYEILFVAKDVDSVALSHYLLLNNKSLPSSMEFFQMTHVVLQLQNLTKWLKLIVKDKKKQISMKIWQGK